MKKQALRLLTVFLLIFFFSPHQKLLAAPYYQGKIIRIIVGVSPGGGFDTMARALAKHLPKHIPGKPVIIIENMTGASTMIAANYLYKVAKPDGLTIASVFRSLVVAQLMKVKGSQFDLNKFSWVGGTGPESYLLTIRNELPFKTYADLLKSKDTLVLGSSGATDATYVFPTLLKAYTGLNVKMAIYPASAEIMLAVERKEVDGRAGSFDSVKPFMERGLIRPMVRGRVTQPGAENIPVDESFATSKLGADVMAMYSASNQIGRPYLAPPGTPAKVMSILRDAFAKVGQDQAFLTDLRRAKMDYDYVPADKCLEILKFTLNQPDNIVEEFKKYVKW